jgi:hypothetical protein
MLKSILVKGAGAWGAKQGRSLSCRETYQVSRTTYKIECMDEQVLERFCSVAFRVLEYAVGTAELPAELLGKMCRCVQLISVAESIDLEQAGSDAAGDKDRTNLADATHCSDHITVAPCRCPGYHRHCVRS